MFDNQVLVQLANQPRAQRMEAALAALTAAPSPAHLRFTLAHILAIAECAGALEVAKSPCGSQGPASAVGVTPPPVGDDAAPANLLDTPDRAAERMVTEVRAFIRRHYDGEIRARGFKFLFRVFADLLAMTYGAALVYQDDDQPDALPYDVQAWADASFAPSVEHYRVAQERAERLAHSIVGAPVPGGGDQWM